MVENDIESVLRTVLGAIIKVQDDTVYLVHQSTKEYLRRVNSIISERFPSLQSNESNRHITVSCLTYLSFDEFDNPKLLMQPWQLGLGYRFFNYASSHWSDHMKQLDAEVQRTPRVKSTFLNLAHNKCRMELVWKQFRHANTHGFQRKQLTMVTNYGLANLIQFLLEDGADTNTQRGGYDGALYVAAAEGHIDIVRLLVEQGANVNAQGGQYGNALQVAAYWGYQDIVRYLVERGADVNAQGGWYGNALLAAAADGSQDIVSLLMELGADVNAQGCRYGNAVQAAQLWGYGNIVDYMVGRTLEHCLLNIRTKETKDTRGKRYLLRVR
jgi:ankyrin repeat protein